MPFDSEIKIMTVIYGKKSDKNNLIFLTKGSVERVLENCSGYVGPSGDVLKLEPGKVIKTNTRV